MRVGEGYRANHTPPDEFDDVLAACVPLSAWTAASVLLGLPVKTFVSTDGSPIFGLEEIARKGAGSLFVCWR